MNVLQTYFVFLCKGGARMMSFSTHIPLLLPSASLCIQSIPLVMAPAHLNPPLPHALEDHQPSEGTWHPHSDHTPNKVLQTHSGDSGQHRKGVTAWQVLAKPPSSPLSLGSSAEPSHSTRVSSVPRAAPGSVLSSGNNPQTT